MHGKKIGYSDMTFIEKRFQAACIVTIILVVLSAFYWGNRKQGFYIDEYYLYTYANGTQQGIDITNGEWNETARYWSQLVSEGEENFRFGQVYEAESNNVHPPLYYYLVHLMSSFFPGVFSKWIGISVNILLLIPIMILVNRLAWILSGENHIVTILTMLLYGLSPMTISMTILVRMYLLLSLWTLLYAYLHVADLKRERLSVTGFLIPLFLCGFCGFLSQYFFVVIMFMITATYSFYLLVFCRRIKDTIIYCLTALLSLVSTYFVWPFSYFHIFKGTRGKGAFAQIKDYSNVIERFLSHIRYVRMAVFGGVLPILFILLIIGIVLLIRRHVAIRSLSVSTCGIILLTIASVINFVALTQIALDDGIFCCRHTYTSCCLFLILIPVGVFRLTDYLVKKLGWLPYVITTVIVAFIITVGYTQKSILFLFEEERQAIDYAKEHSDAKVIVFNYDDGMYDSVIQQILMYPKVYFADINDLNTARDGEISNSDELIVYVPRDDDMQTECFDSIYDQNDRVSQTDHLWDFEFLSVYRMH